MSETAETIQYLFRVLAASQVLLLTLHLLIHHRNALGTLAALTSFGFVSYLIVPFSREVWALGVMHHLFIFLATSIPALLWLLARKFFGDEARVPIWFWLVWLGYLILWLPNWQVSSLEPGLSDFVFNLVPQLIKLGFILHVIYLAFEGRANDLVAERLKLRVPVAITAGTVTGVVILVEIWSAGAVPTIIETTGSIAMFALALFANLYLFRLRPELPLTDTVSVPATADPLANVSDSEEIARIEEAMSANRFYANHGATIGDLAVHVGIPAYRLRALINRRLGYRNFNQYLNQHRIDEASARIIAEPGLPILTIALDSGFKSVSSFNTAFKAIHARTPSELRNASRKG